MKNILSITFIALFLIYCSPSLKDRRQYQEFKSIDSVLAVSIRYEHKPKQEAGKPVTSDSLTDKVVVEVEVHNRQREPIYLVKDMRFFAINKNSLVYTVGEIEAGVEYDIQLTRIEPGAKIILSVIHNADKFNQIIGRANNGLLSSEQVEKLSIEARLSYLPSFHHIKINNPQLTDASTVKVRNNSVIMNAVFRDIKAAIMIPIE